MIERLSHAIKSLYFLTNQNVAEFWMVFLTSFIAFNQAKLKFTSFYSDWKLANFDYQQYDAEMMPILIAFRFYHQGLGLSARIARMVEFDPSE